MQLQLDGIRTEMAGMQQRMGGMEQRLGAVEQTVHNIAVTVARHEGYFVQITDKLKKLDILDQIKSTLDAVAGHLQSSRDERALSDKSFREQQATLSDH